MRDRRLPLAKLASLALLTTSQGWAQASIDNLPPEILMYADTVYVNARIVTLDDHEMT